MHLPYKSPLDLLDYISILSKRHVERVEHDDEEARAKEFSRICSGTVTKWTANHHLCENETVGGRAGPFLTTRKDRNMVQWKALIKEKNRNAALQFTLRPWYCNLRLQYQNRCTRT